MGERESDAERARKGVARALAPKEVCGPPKNDEGLETCRPCFVLCSQLAVWGLQDLDLMMLMTQHWSVDSAQGGIQLVGSKGACSNWCLPTLVLSRAPYVAYLVSLTIAHMF